MNRCKYPNFDIMYTVSSVKGGISVSGIADLSVALILSPSSQNLGLGLGLGLGSQIFLSLSPISPLPRHCLAWCDISLRSNAYNLEFVYSRWLIFSRLVPHQFAQYQSMREPALWHTLKLGVKVQSPSCEFKPKTNLKICNHEYWVMPALNSFLFAL